MYRWVELLALTLSALIVASVCAAKSPSNSTEQWITVKAEVTAYTLAECGKSPSSALYGVTASGRKVSNDTVAAPTNFPFGTKLHIPGYGKGYVKDRGGHIKYHPSSRGGYYRMDVYMRSRYEANRWGRKKMDVKVYVGNLSNKTVSGIKK
jgi:3D (Asp-Asp-Asp) domain-containing protein